MRAGREGRLAFGSKQMRKPKKDGWFEHGMNCAEYLELNFVSAPPKPKSDPFVLPPDLIPRYWMGT